MKNEAMKIISEQWNLFKGGNGNEVGKFDLFITGLTVNDDDKNFNSDMGLTAYGFSNTEHEILYYLMLFGKASSELKGYLANYENSVNTFSLGSMSSISDTEIRKNILKLIDVGIDQATIDDRYIRIVGSSPTDNAVLAEYEGQTISGYNFIRVHIGTSGTGLHLIHLLGCSLLGCKISSLRTMSGCRISESIIAVTDGMEMNGCTLENVEFIGSGSIILTDSIIEQDYRLFTDCIIPSGVTFVDLVGNVIQVVG